VSNDSDDSAAKSAFSSADPPRNFTLSINERIRALTIGPPAYATRKKGIEDLVERYIETLVVHHAKRAARLEPAERDDRDGMTKALLEKAATLDLARLNRLIETHNRYYPIEANLATDLRTGEYLVHGRRWSPEDPWTALRLVEEARARIAAR
jgi:hypothetical protein